MSDHNHHRHQNDTYAYQHHDYTSRIMQQPVPIPLYQENIQYPNPQSYYTTQYCSFQQPSFEPPNTTTPTAATNNRPNKEKKPLFIIENDQYSKDIDKSKKPLFDAKTDSTKVEQEVKEENNEAKSVDKGLRSEKKKQLLIDLNNDNSSNMVTEPYNQIDQKENISEVKDSHDIRPKVDIVPPVKDALRKEESIKKEVTETKKPVPVSVPMQQRQKGGDKKSKGPKHPPGKVGLTKVRPTEADPRSKRISYDREFMIKIKKSPIVVAIGKTKKIPYVFNTVAKAKSREHRIEININDTEIDRVEGAFVPTKLRKKSDDKQSELNAKNELNMILNQLMDDKLDESFMAIQNLGLTSAKHLNELAEDIFQKATSQRKFSKTFARFSKLIKEKTGQNGSKHFLVALLGLARQKMEMSMTKIVEEASKKVDEEIKNTTDDKVKLIHEENRETVINKHKDFYFGNIHFIGELFLEGLFTVKSLLDILKNFSSTLTPENVECLIILFNICGAEIDNDEHKGKIDNIFKNIETNMKTAGLESFQEFKLNKIIKLRKDGWKSEIKKPSVILGASDIARTLKTSLKKPDQPYPKTNHVPTDSSSIKLTPSTGSWLNKKQNSNAPKSAWGSKPVANVPDDKYSIKDLSDDDYTKFYDSVKSSRPVTLYGCDEDSYVDVFKKKYPSIVLHSVFEYIIDRKEPERMQCGDMVVSLLTKKILTEKHVEDGFMKFWSNMYEYWDEEYPLGSQYLAEIFYKFLLKLDDCNFLVDVLKHQKNQDDDKPRAAIVLAKAYALAAKEKSLSETDLLKKITNIPMKLVELGVDKNGLSKFCSTHDCIFLMDAKVVSTPVTAPVSANPRGPATTRTAHKSLPHGKSQQVPSKTMHTSSTVDHAPKVSDDEFQVATKKKGRHTNNTYNHFANITKFITADPPKIDNAIEAINTKMSNVSMNMMMDLARNVCSKVYESVSGKSDMERLVDVLKPFSQKSDLQMLMLNELQVFSSKDSIPAILRCLVVREVLSKDTLLQYIEKKDNPMYPKDAELMYPVVLSLYDDLKSTNV